MNDEEYNKYLKELDNKRKKIIAIVEEDCYGSSEAVLPALFFVDFKEMGSRNILSLHLAIEMFYIGNSISK